MNGTLTQLFFFFLFACLSLGSCQQLQELVVNFVNRWTSASRGRERIPKPILLTYRECQIVARIVFGSEKDPLYVSFMAMVDRHVRGRKMRGNDSRRIEVYQFLHVALVGYHETRPAEDEEEIAAAEGIEAGMLSSGHDFSAGQVLVGSKDEQERLFIEAERDYESRMYVFFVFFGFGCENCHTLTVQIEPPLIVDVVSFPSPPFLGLNWQARNWPPMVKLNKTWIVK